jgi:putative protein kinase ArgK-like GTPase of G3E family
MQFIRRKNIHWAPKVMTMSAHTGFQLDKVEEEIFGFHKLMMENGSLIQKKTSQTKQWTLSQFRMFESNQNWQLNIASVFQQIDKGTMTPRGAANTRKCTVRSFNTIKRE